MMASSFIDYKNKGFWIKDDILQITLAYVYLVIDRRKDHPGWLQDMRQLIKDNSLGYYSSYMHLKLDEYLHDDITREAFLNIVKDTEAMIRQKSEVLDIAELNKWLFDEKIKDRWEGNVERNRLLKVLEWLGGLVVGEINTQSSDPIDYFF